jgi:anti-sigma regulatory factor (Ser/Thr protein kinase)
MNLVDSSRPPPHAIELRHWSLTNGDQLRALRASLTQALRRERLADGTELDEIAERVVLVATELATNALQHGLPPTTVRLLRYDDQLVLDVVDHDPGSAPQSAAASLTSERGRGLAIARLMSLEVGWYAAAETKHVWASFPTTGAGRLN